MSRAPRPEQPTEAVVTAAIRLRLGLDPDVVLWRNSAGRADHVGESGRVHTQSFGLQPGAADFIGIIMARVQKRAEDVLWPAPGASRDPSCLVGRFLSLEVKRPRVTATEARALGIRPQAAGTLAPDQRVWRDLVRRRGGVAIVVRSADEAAAAVDRARRDPAWRGEGYDE